MSEKPQGNNNRALAVVAIVALLLITAVALAALHVNVVELTQGALK